LGQKGCASLAAFISARLYQCETEQHKSA